MIVADVARGAQQGGEDDAVGRLGQVITAELQRLKWSRRRLARESGVSHTAIGELIRGATRPEVHTLYRLAEALKINPQYLIEALTQDTGLSESERAFIDRIPADEIDAFLEAMRKIIEEDETRTLMYQIKAFIAALRRGR